MTAPTGNERATETKSDRTCSSSHTQPRWKSGSWTFPATISSRIWGKAILVESKVLIETFQLVSKAAQDVYMGYGGQASATVIAQNGPLFAIRLLDLPQNVLGARQVRLAGLGLDIELLHDAVLDQHRIAFRAHAEAGDGKIDVEPDRLGEGRVPVSEEVDLSLGARRFRPCSEHVVVVDRGHGDTVNALGAKTRLVGDEARQMVLVARRREGARQAEQHHRLADEVILRLDRLRTVRGDEHELRVGQAVANLDGHGAFLRLMVRRMAGS